MPRKKEEALLEFTALPSKPAVPAGPRARPRYPKKPEAPAKQGAKVSVPRSSSNGEADAEDFSDFGVAALEEKTDITRLSETLFNTTDMRGKTNVNDAQIRCIMAIDTLGARYPFLRIREDFTVPLMHILTSRGGWSRTGLQETLKGFMQQMANQQGPTPLEKRPGF